MIADIEDDENSEEKWNEPAEEKWNEGYWLGELQKRFTTGKPCSSEDFIPKDYQTELANVAKDKNKILYVPHTHYKLHTATLIVKYFARDCEELKSKKIFYLVSSDRLAESVVCFLQKHTAVNVTGVLKEISEKNDWNGVIEKSDVIVIPSAFYLYALNKCFTEPAAALLIVFDDCVFGTGGHSMKHTMEYFNDFDTSEWPRVIGLTSYLVHHNLKLEKEDSVYEALKALEVTFKATIGASLYCIVSKRQEHSSAMRCAERILTPQEWIHMISLAVTPAGPGIPPHYDLIKKLNLKIPECFHPTSPTRT